ncbi:MULTISPECIES: DUF7793 family protein [Arthrobacter]|uniref:DUF7793 family protein n=1 Tax=Arthrobacter TaxID=1663 RepID=UPI000478AF19|nr:STAS/SEC14 domain-containing protein [Arthrobacter sp. 35/47]
MNETGADSRFALTRENGYVRVEWDEDISVTEQDALDLLDRLDQECPGVCKPMLANLNSMVTVHAPALAIFASRLNVAALAIVGPTAVDRTIATFFSEVHEPAYPTRYFTEPAAALEWLLTPGHGAPGTEG